MPVSVWILSKTLETCSDHRTYPSACATPLDMLHTVTHEQLRLTVSSAGHFCNEGIFCRYMETIAWNCSVPKWVKQRELGACDSPCRASEVVTIGRPAGMYFHYFMQSVWGLQPRSCMQRNHGEVGWFTIDFFFSFLPQFCQVKCHTEKGLAMIYKISKPLLGRPMLLAASKRP